MTKTIKLLLLPILLFGLTGCLEHRYFITALPDQRVSVHYELRGDRADIEDGYELLPDSTEWNLKRTVEETDEQTTHIYAGDRILKEPFDLAQALNWSRGPGDSVYFAPNLSLKSKGYPFVRIWTFYGAFSNLKFLDRYGDMWDFVPEECRILEDSEAMESVSTAETTILERKFGLGVIQWTKARYENSFDDVWKVARLRPGILTDSTENSMAILRTAWVADIHAYLNGLDVGDPQTTKLNWWKDLRPMLLGRFVEIADVNGIDELGRIADAVENRYLISKDMDDDNFVVEVTVPGRIIKTNGVKQEAKVRWEVAGKDFQNESQYLTATAVELDWRQIAIGLVGIGVVIWAISRRRDKQDE